jgi:hypothetical protein
MCQHKIATPRGLRLLRKIILFSAIFVTSTNSFSLTSANRSDNSKDPSGFESLWKQREKLTVPQPFKCFKPEELINSENKLYSTSFEAKFKNDFKEWFDAPRKAQKFLLFRILHSLSYLPHLIDNKFSEEQLKLLINNITFVALTLIKNEYFDINAWDWEESRNTPLHYVTMLLSASSAHQEKIYLHLMHQCIIIIDALLRRNANLLVKNIYSHEFNCDLYETFNLTNTTNNIAKFFIAFIEACYQRNVEKLPANHNSTKIINLQISGISFKAKLKRLTPIEILLRATPASQEIADIIVNIIKKLLKTENTQRILYNHKHQSYGERDLNKTQFYGMPEKDNSDYIVPDVQFYFRTKLDKIIPYGVGFPKLIDDEESAASLSDITLTTEE